MIGSVTQPYLGERMAPGWGRVTDLNDPAQVKLLENDGHFLQTVASEMDLNGVARGDPKSATMVLAALSKTDLSTLSPSERAQIVRSVQMLRSGYGTHPDQGAAAIVKTIEVMSNNQGYTGPGCDQVLATVPKAGGGVLNVTRGEVLDNEGFADVVNKVFVAAGGKLADPDPRLKGMVMGGDPNMTAPGSWIGTGLPQAWASGRGGADMSKWSEEERVSFLKLVADFGRDGTLSGPEMGTINQAIQDRNQGGAQEASLTLPNGQKIGLDDVMENSTFQKQLLKMTEMVGLTAGPAGTELRALIASADYGQLSLAERSALLMELGVSPKTHVLNSDDAAKVLQTLKAALVPAPQSRGVGTTLSNGMFVSQASVADDNGFGGLVQKTLQRSGVPAAIASSASMSTAASHNAFSVPRLLTLDVSRLSPAQRIQVLELIAKASSDKVIDTKELYAIQDEVSRMSGGRSQFV